jgi:hypothetical protein
MSFEQLAGPGIRESNVMRAQFAGYENGSLK